MLKPLVIPAGAGRQPCRSFAMSRQYLLGSQQTPRYPTLTTDHLFVSRLNKIRLMPLYPRACTLWDKLDARLMSWYTDYHARLRFQGGRAVLKSIIKQAALKAFPSAKKCPAVHDGLRARFQQQRGQRNCEATPSPARWQRATCAGEGMHQHCRCLVHAGMVLPAEVLKQGSSEDVDLSLLLVDEEKLPASMRLTSDATM
jgi:hypothetical protein